MVKLRQLQIGQQFTVDGERYEMQELVTYWHCPPLVLVGCWDENRGFFVGCYMKADAEVEPGPPPPPSSPVVRSGKW